ncbi:unnamed protein product [Camellia sinensis]
MSALSVSALVCIWVLLCFYGGVNGYGYIKYNTGSGIVEGKLNVHFVPHSHDDVGWLKTIDQYYVGSNNSIQGACVENVLDSVMVSLLKDPNRKFIFAEMSRRRLIAGGEEDNMKSGEEKMMIKIDEILVYINAKMILWRRNGGWCMHDEATSHYIDMIDQTTLGHRAIKNQFNITPRAGWQIDPFGHSAVQAYLLGTELGFDSVHFARIDYQDRAKRKQDKSLEVVWRGSKTFGSSSQIFTNTFPVHYSPPNGFEFEVSDDFMPVQDNPLLYDYNVEQRVNDVINAAITQANVTRTNHIMWTMGDDFQYQYAESWFKQMDKLIHYVNKDGRINVLYSTPSLYTDAKNAENGSWPLKTDDYFPYADDTNAYWTGFFTSRPAFKRYIRMLSGYYLRASIFTPQMNLLSLYAYELKYILVLELVNMKSSTKTKISIWHLKCQLWPLDMSREDRGHAARQLEFLAGRRSAGPNTYSLGDALGIAQHHDAVSGTAKQHTTNDYEKRLARGASEAQCATTLPTLSQECQLLNISYCPPTEEEIPDGKSLVVVAYNPLGWNRTDIIRIPVNDGNLVVQDSMGNTMEAQYVELDNVTSNLRDFYTMAYLGISPGPAPKYWILFKVSLPPLGWNTYFVSKAAGKGNSRSVFSSVVGLPQNDSVEIGPGNLKMSFSVASGQLERMFNARTGVDIPVQQSYLWYGSSSGDTDPQCSGAYIFRPNGSPPTVVSRAVPLKVVRGTLVDEVHQQFDSWIYQVIRLYKDKEHAEVEFTIGPIPTDDSVGKEIITRMTANMVTDKVFYTDSNGRDFLKRGFEIIERTGLFKFINPLQGTIIRPKINTAFYVSRTDIACLLNLGIYTVDKKSEFSVLVDRAVGGASIEDGEVELMLHRRTIFDDSRGVGEALDETVCAENRCEGLTLGAGSQWRRTTGQEVYSPILLAFTQEKLDDWKASHLTMATAMDPNYTLPLNVALITLQELDDGSVLLRLAHLYEAGEDAEYSTLAKVELKQVFSGKMIKEVKEVSLSTNQDKSQMKKMTWKVEGDNGGAARAIRGGPVNISDLVVELGPMEIRTFLLTFYTSS